MGYPNKKDIQTIYDKVTEKINIKKEDVNFCRNLVTSACLKNNYTAANIKGILRLALTYGLQKLKTPTEELTLSKEDIIAALDEHHNNNNFKITTHGY